MSTANSVIAQLQSDLQFANDTTGASDTTIHDAITTLVSGFGGGKLEDFIPEEAFHVTGNCYYRFANNFLDWLLINYGDKITTSDISNASRMFINSKIKYLPFELNFVNGGCDVSALFSACSSIESMRDIDFKHSKGFDCSSMFAYNSELREIGKFSNLIPTNTSEMFRTNVMLRYLPEFENLNLSYIQTNNSARCNLMFSACNSLRKIPEDILEQLYVSHSNANYTQFYEMYRECFALDELVGINPQTGTLTTGTFSNTFYRNSRAKNIIFATQEDGTPYSVNWKNQTINLAQYVGYATGSVELITTGRNSGITADKQVITDADYQNLKNDPDWFTTDVNYSRYNHDSAVNTINSLPDTSAYLATAGGTNTIKFTGQSGVLTDGGAINTLTEAEIAVATAKGWTVTFV